MAVLAIFLCVLAASKSVLTDLEGEANASAESSKVSARLGDDVEEVPYGVDRKTITSEQQQQQVGLRDARKRTSDQGVAGRQPVESMEMRSLEKSELFLNVAPFDRKTKVNNTKMFNGTLDGRTSPSNNASTEVDRKKYKWATYLNGLRTFAVALRVTGTEGNLEKNETGNSFLRRKRAYDVNDPYFVSLNEYNANTRKLPLEVQYATVATNHFEGALLLGYATSTGKRDDIDSLLTEYIQAKCRERNLLKERFEKAGAAAQQLVADYKSLRKGVPWLYVKLDCNLKSFFDAPSAFLTEYDLLKRDELDSIDSFLDGTVQCDEWDAGNKTKQGVEKPSAAVEEVKKAEEEEEELMRVKDADTTRSLSESYEAMRAVRRRLPEDLQKSVEATDVVEEKLIESYATVQSASTKLLASYYAAKKVERELMKELVSEMTPAAANDLLNNYKTLRKGRVWSYVKLQDKLKTFFRRFSPALLEFETLKMDELTSIDRFLKLHHQGAAETSVTKTIDQAVEHETELTEEGRGTYAELLRSFPKALSNSILQTDGFDRQMVESYAKTQSVPKVVLDSYKTARNEERETLRKLIVEQPENKTRLVESYKALRKGSAWNFTLAEHAYVEFFNHPSTALTDYEALKKEELTTLDAFLDGKPKKKYRGAMKRYAKEDPMVRQWISMLKQSTLHHQQEASRQTPASQTKTDHHPGITTPTRKRQQSSGKHYA